MIWPAKSNDWDIIQTLMTSWKEPGGWVIRNNLRKFIRLQKRAFQRIRIRSASTFRIFHCLVREVLPHVQGTNRKADGTTSNFFGSATDQHHENCASIPPELEKTAACMTVSKKKPKEPVAKSTWGSQHSLNFSLTSCVFFFFLDFGFLEDNFDNLSV